MTWYLPYAATSSNLAWTKYRHALRVPAIGSFRNKNEKKMLFSSGNVRPSLHFVKAWLLWYCLEWPWKADNYLGAGIRVVFVLLGRRILDGKPGASGGKAWALPQKLLSSIPTQPAQVSNNGNLPNKQTWEGIPVVHTRNLTKVCGRSSHFFAANASPRSWTQKLA